jgi:DNA-binding GntR family transcriptional regulator
MMPSVMPSLVSRRSLDEQAAEVLRELIISGALDDGQRLVEAELCERLGISRTPLREALRVLATEGLVVHMPHRGAAVAVMTETEIAHLFEVLADLERLAVRLAMARMEVRARRRLRRRHDRMIALHGAARRRDCFEADYALHNLLVAEAGNPVLVETHERLMRRAKKSRYRALFDQARWDEAMEEHEALIAAIEVGEVSAAETLMQHHVLHTGEALRRILAADVASATKNPRPTRIKRRHSSTSTGRPT